MGHRVRLGPQDDSPACTAAPPATEPKRPRTETAGVRRGCERREALAKVATLLAHDKSKQVREAFAAVEPGPAATNSLTKAHASELRSLLFTFGGLNLTQASLERFLAMPEVKRLLDEDVLKT